MNQQTLFDLGIMRRCEKCQQPFTPEKALNICNWCHLSGVIENGEPYTYDSISSGSGSVNPQELLMGAGYREAEEDRWERDLEILEGGE